MGDENSIFRIGINPFAVKMETRIGIRVEITYPVRIAYDIKTTDEIVAVSMAFNTARHDFSNIDWSKGRFKTSPYIYINGEERFFI